MARRALLHSALFKHGLSKGFESGPRCKVTPRCPQPGTVSSPTRGCGALGFTVLPLNLRAVNAPSMSGTHHANSTNLWREG